VHDVVVVEDEAELAQSVADYLRAFDLSVQVFPSAEAAQPHLERERPRVLLLDINLPGRSGFDLCRELRRASDVPILFLTARASEDDEVLALSIGGDDYLRKPFSLGVLLAKIRRILARQDATGGASVDDTGDIDDGFLRIDGESERVFVDGREVVLPAMEHRLLHYLVAERDRVVSKQELLERVWHDEFVGDGTLSVHIRRLRTKLERDPDNPRYLRTAWGRGYMFSSTP
jgi:two-component system response regulator RegX3